MTDIVDRLRSRYRISSIDDEAADEIERLRRAVDAGIEAGWHALRTERDELLQAHTALVARLHDVTTMLEAERARIAGAPTTTLEWCDFNRGLWINENTEDAFTGKRVALVVLP
jgi:hypothetical protein